MPARAGQPALRRRTRAADRSTNPPAVKGDMRPGSALNAFARSRNSSWSMPKFRPVAYSRSVAAPMAQTDSASTERRPVVDALHRLASSSSARPARSMPSAELGFICTAPGMTLLTASRPVAQPTRTARPTPIAIAAATGWRMALASSSARSPAPTPGPGSRAEDAVTDGSNLAACRQVRQGLEKDLADDPPGKHSPLASETPVFLFWSPSLEDRCACEQR